MENPMKKMDTKKQKAIGTVISFFISLGVFIMIRVLGVMYFADTFVEAAEFSPFAALNLMVWVGIASVILIAFVMLNFSISADKQKLNMDVISAAVLTIGLYWMISYNYVGFTYPSLLVDKDVFQRIFVYGTYWVSVFAVYGNSDLFLFWLGVSAVFHGLFFLFSIVDLDDKMFAMFKRKSRTKAAPDDKELSKTIYGAVDFFSIEVLSVFTNIIVIFVPMLYIYPGLARTIFTVEGIMFVTCICALNTLFYILSKRMKSKRQGTIFYLAVSIIFTSMNLIFMIIQSTIVALVLISAAVGLVALVANVMIRK